MAEKRLIDANGLWSDIMMLPHNGDMISSEEVEQAIMDSPTLDVVEVVRCKECAKDGLLTCPICFIENKTLKFINHSPDFYCGEGERRTDDA